MNCRVLRKGKCNITQAYSNYHGGIDIVGDNYSIDDIIAHSSGVVIDYEDGKSNQKGSTGRIAYGNFIKIDHGNGYYTLYAHMKSGLNIKKGQKINKGDILGTMSDSGNAYGVHLHFEVFKDGLKIDPTNYLNNDIVINNTNLNYNLGDVVSINGVYISSTSNDRLVPLIKKGTITKILEGTKNPYLLDNGKIGWINDNCIISKDNIYLSNKLYNGFSIVDALKQINIDSSYNNRSILASLNGIKNYKGTASQNEKLLNLLKQGKLKSS